MHLLVILITKSLVVANTGYDTLYVSNIRISDPFSVDTVSFTLAPGDSQILNITYNPTSLGVDSATMVIESDAFNNPNYGILLVGKAYCPPEISLDTTAITLQLIAGDVEQRQIIISKVAMI